MYVQVPRGSIVTASKAFAPQKSPNLCLKRRRSNPDTPTLDRIVCASKLFRGSYGDPVLEGRRPGGSVSAIMGQGSQAYLSLPPSCGGVSYSKAKQHGSHYSSGIREEEWDGKGTDESRGNCHSALAIESVLR